MNAEYKRGDLVVAELTGATCRLVRRAAGIGRAEGFWLAVVVVGHPATVGGFEHIKPARLA